MYTKNVDTPTSIVTSINEQVGGITISQESLGFDKKLAEKADVGHTHDYAGSATSGGPATSAKKLNTDAGSSTKPVYFKNGMPVATQYEIKASVPKNAQFTDTKYEATTGETPGLIKLYDEIGNNTDGAMTQAAINNISSTMADKSTVVNKILLVSNWVYGYLLPHKGDLITMDLGNGDKTYRVLKINGNIAECLAMYEASILKYNTTSKTITMGDTTVQQYANSDLDNYLNTTWYNTLSNAARAAIVPKVVIQDAWQYWTSLSHTYSGTYGTEVPGTTNYSISKYDGGTLTVGNRNVYAIGVQDVIDYLSDESLRVDTTAILRNVNIWKMFWNTKTQPSSIYYPWLCSAYVGDPTCVSIVSRNKGRLAQSGCSNSNAARPAFQIDLSKIAFKGTSAPYRYELSVDGVTKTSNQEIIPADGITDEQMYHLQGANLQDGGQDTNKIVLEAFGVKPSIDIPIKIIMRKD